MPKAIRITDDNLDLISSLSGWEKDPQCVGYLLVTDVQFPHGYVDMAIVTEATFNGTFKELNHDISSTELVPVNYI